MNDEHLDGATVTAPAGTVRGLLVEGGVRRFLGLPYAEPPIGDRRFTPPIRRPQEQDGIDATEYGPTVPQSPPSGPLGTLLPHTSIAGDDILNLNIWSPADGDAHPVMVFIHGGSWTSGAGSIAGYDGTRFARDGVVLVTINYRLGADGFAWFGEDTANRGLLDQICALEWVHDNIAAFGGAPENVTVFGESAGAMSIGALLAMPRTFGLFRRAIMESGSTAHTIDAASARLVARRLARILEVEPSIAGLASVPVDALLAGQDRLAAELSSHPTRGRWGDAGVNGLPFEPVVDHSTLPERPLDALRAGWARDVELMVGWNAEGANLVLAPAGIASIPPRMLRIAAYRTHLSQFSGLRAYRRVFRSAPAGAAVGAILTDWAYRIPAIRTAETRPGTHVYEFAWRSPALGGDLGAAHGVELPFVFDALDSPDWTPLVGDGPPGHIAAAMHRSWIEFAKTGDPGWEPYSADHRVVRRFDTESTTLIDPDHERRIAWYGRR